MPMGPADRCGGCRLRRDRRRDAVAQGRGRLHRLDHAGEAVDREPQLGHLRLALRARRQMRSHRGGFFGVDRAQGERPEQVACCGVSGHGQVRFHD